MHNPTKLYLLKIASLAILVLNSCNHKQSGMQMWGNNDLVDIPDEFLCPITQEMMENPVVAADGHTYERAAIVQWLQGHRTSPLTNERLKHDTLTDNFALKKAIVAFKKKTTSNST